MSRKWDRTQKHVQGLLPHMVYMGLIVYFYVVLILPAEDNGDQFFQKEFS